ncbi:MAG: hypothetical protein K7J46_02255 [Bryobacter sp.]|nr:hypothetical protein [Bryobacter sp. CoA8 C33]
MFDLEAPGVEESRECLGAQVLMGQKKPPDCLAIGGRCTTQYPPGVPGVSIKGASSACFPYRSHLVEIATPAS